MPYSIAAETVGIGRESLAKYLPGYKNHLEWRDVWAQILADQKLLNLHYAIQGYIE